MGNIRIWKNEVVKALMKTSRRVRFPCILHNMELNLTMQLRTLVNLGRHIRLAKNLGMNKIL